MKFGTSGIRGPVGTVITPDLFYRIGKIMGDYDSTVFLGTDARASGPYLKHALLTGLYEAGVEALDCGIVPTPTLGFLCGRAKHYGIMITASHNPPHHNGIKIIDSLGKEISRKTEQEIEAKLATSEPFHASSYGNRSEYGSAIDEHIAFLLSHTPPLHEPFPFLVDAGNGAGAHASPQALVSLGLKPLTLFCEYAPIPSRGLEPTPENLTAALSLVRAKRIVGVAHDGDCDRAMFFDAQGLIGQDEQLAAMIDLILTTKGAGTIISTVEASLLIRDVVEKHGGTLIITPVGSRHIAEKMQETHALFGGEPCGEYIFPLGHGMPDALYTTLLFASSLSRQPALLRTYKKSTFLRRGKWPCAEHHKTSVLARIGEIVEKEDVVINRLDGIRGDGDTFWFLIRPSGTEEYIRLTVEHKDARKGEELYKKLEGIIKECITHA